MKKKILLIISMFLFMSNAKALTFNVGLTNIEDKGSGSLGTIKRIDVEDRNLDVFFEEIGAEVNFELTISNSGDRAGTLKEINVTGTSDKIEYTTNLPEGGLAINGNDTNKVIITGKVKEGATNGKSTSEIKITYNYDEGSCPEGEILSEDESMCLCPEGKERNEKGVCVTPEKQIVCKDDEIYNETKKICEKKVVPPVPNPKTLDNIILVTLLFVVSGLGIYAVMFNKLKTNKKKITAGVITGVATLTLSFTVLATAFGIDNLLSAIINPITKSKEITVTVYEEIELIETWDGTCSIPDASLIPSNIFDGGAGTESNPYKIKTANQLACFARSVTLGTTYEGQYIKQTKNIKLNDDLNGQAESGDLSNAHLWKTAGYSDYNYDLPNRYDAGAKFSGTYDGDNHTISGLYLTVDSISVPAQVDWHNYVGMFAFAKNATFKNMKLADVYMDTYGTTGALVGYGYENLTLSNITTYGTGVFTKVGNNYANYGAGVISYHNGHDVGTIKIEDTTNNINLYCDSSCGGIIAGIDGIPNSSTPNIIFKNDTNNGKLTFSDATSGSGGILGYYWSYDTGNALFENCANTADFEFKYGDDWAGGGGGVGGLVGYFKVRKMTIKDSHNSGNIYGFDVIGGVAGIGGDTGGETIMDNVYNSGNITAIRYIGSFASYAAGLLGSSTDQEKDIDIRNCYNTGDLYLPNNRYVAGIIGKHEDDEVALAYDRKIVNCYNTGDMTGEYAAAGIVGQFGGEIYNSYNTGNIYSDNNTAGGIVGYGGSNVYNSYNEGTITLYHGGAYVGGICAADCDEVKNSYNRGDVIVLEYCEDVGGITGQYGIVTNSYNSGNLITKGKANSRFVGGIGYGLTATNTYNLGDIIFENAGSGVYVGGIATSTGSATNSVNKGNVIITIKEQYQNPAYFTVGGISCYGSSNNSFNSGIVKFVNPDGTNYPIYDDVFNNEHHSFKIGEILGDSIDGTGNKYNTNSNKYAIGCMNNESHAASCTEEASLGVGTYTPEDAPDILSIINGDDAFEIKEGEALPTLKVFNQ